MTNSSLVPITSVEQSRDLTEKSLKISKQIILETYKKEQEKNTAERLQQLSAFLLFLKEKGYESLDSFRKELGKYIVSTARLRVASGSEITRLRNLMNKVFFADIKSNSAMFDFCEPDMYIPSDISKPLHYFLDKISEKYKPIDKVKDVFEFEYSYTSQILNVAGLTEHQREQEDVDNCRDEQAIDIIIPSTFGVVISRIMDYLKVIKDLILARAGIQTKIENIDIYLEKLEAQLLVKELKDTGNTHALDTIQGIVQMATGDQTLTLGETK